MAAKRVWKKKPLRSRQTMRMSRKRPLQNDLRPLGTNEYRTKLYGLMALKELSKATGIKVLGFKVCNDPARFSISGFSNPQKGRFIIRTDPITESQVQTMVEWAKMPRLNFYLRGKRPKKSEALIRDWMREKKAANPNIRFILHKVRNLVDYDRSIQLNIDLSRGEINISTTKAATDRFRDEKVQTGKLALDDNDRIRREIGSRQPIVLPEVLQSKTISVIRELISYARKTGHKVFEASCVTYKDKPNELEFYDLVFGKKM